jgi:hypothetical protein
MRSAVVLDASPDLRSDFIQGQTELIDLPEARHVRFSQAPAAWRKQILRQAVPESKRLSLALSSPRPWTSSSVLSRPRALLKPPPFAS